jgi:adhesin transport system membrane fusion protein
MRPGLINAGRSAIGVLERVRSRFDPLLGRVFGQWPGPEERELSVLADADQAILRQEPLRARVVLRVAMLATIILLVWAGLAQIDEVTKGEGKVIPSRQLQVIQSVDGGVVSEVLVKEGQVVDSGQLLLRIDQTRFVSTMRESRSQYLSLQAKAARLRALAEGKPFVPPEDVKKEDPNTVAAERSLYESRRSELETNIAISRQQLAQRQQELVEVKSRRDAAQQGLDLSLRELAVTKPLISSGAVSEVDILRLERDVSRYRGERDQSAAQISRIGSAINEAERKIQEVELNFRNESRKELAETVTRLNSLLEGGVGLADKVDKAMVRSPVKGTVNRILVNTVGGVVLPGKEVIEIVPLEDALLLEARVAPKDIGFLAAGQPALVKFTAYDFSIYGGLDAKVEHIASDTVTDDKGNAFYVIRVRTDKPRLAADLPIIPGMVAEVDVKTGKKSVLSYMLKPVLRAKAVALTER